MQARLSLTFRMICAALVLLGAVVSPSVFAQAPARDNHISADLVAEHAPVPGETMTVALRFRPEKGWHGYWLNPGDAGEGMQVVWQLPEGWEAGEPQYPVPHIYEAIGLINHVYDEDYAVLVPIAVPERAAVMNFAPITADVSWLACSVKLCVQEELTLTLRFPTEGPALRAEFDEHRAAIPPMIDAEAKFAISDKTLHIAIPLPESAPIANPHVFIEQNGLIDYAAVQTYSRDGDLLIVEIPRSRFALESEAVSGILALNSNGNGIRFSAVPGEVPQPGMPLRTSGLTAPIWLLLGGALLGGLLLNLMPCVFPILSLKALTLARAGESGAKARSEGLAYTAGVLLACLALGALLLLLRSAGEQIGWAFQLQEPLVVAGLLVLVVLVTANVAGLFELPGLPIRSGGQIGAFGTGLLAAVVATPCTGPFMAAALGAALLLPWWQALALFAAMGLGLALPFLALGFVPPLRAMLPKPGAWMERFRHIMAVPMGLTALALVWLAYRLGGVHFAFSALALGIMPVVAITAWRSGNRIVTAIAVAIAVYFAVTLPSRQEEKAGIVASGIIEAEPFSKAALAEARSSGKPVFVWFTADWCLTCKVNEQVAIEREATREAFEKAGVIALRGDWTRRDPAITRFLEARGAAGIPLYLWYPAGGSEPQQLPQLLSPDSLTELAEQP